MKKLILILPILAGFLFGSTGVFTRTLTAEGFNNVTILAVRTLFATVLMGILILAGNRSLFKIRPKDLPLFLGTGLLSMMCLNLCYNAAVNRLALSLAAVLLGTAPLFVLLFAAILFKEKITARKIGCLALALFGCILACGLSGQTGSTVLSYSGILPGVAAAVFCALYSIFSKLAAQKVW